MSLDFLHKWSTRRTKEEALETEKENKEATQLRCPSQFVVDGILSGDRGSLLTGFHQAIAVPL